MVAISQQRRPYQTEPRAKTLSGSYELKSRLSESHRSRFGYADRWAFSRAAEGSAGRVPQNDAVHYAVARTISDGRYV